MSDTKIKINLKEGTFEIEGSESFVEKYWEKLTRTLEKLPITYQINPSASSQLDFDSSKTTNGTKKKNQKSKPSFELLPLDLTKKEDRPSLKELFDEKKPSSNQEIITLFSYYLTKFLQIPNMKYGHALFCYNEINRPKPTNIVQLFRDTSHLKKWVESGDEPHTVKLTIAGKNLIEHKLQITESMNKEVK